MILEEQAEACVLIGRPRDVAGFDTVTVYRNLVVGITGNDRITFRIDADVVVVIFEVFFRLKKRQAGPGLHTRNEITEQPEINSTRITTASFFAR
jgi:hypothetical protein